MQILMEMMNIHCPQDIESQIELGIDGGNKQIMNAQIINLLSQ